MRFVVGREALGEDFLRVPRFSCVSIILPKLRANCHLRVGVTGRTNVRNVGTLPTCRNREGFDGKCFHFLFEKDGLVLNALPGRSYVFWDVMPC